MKYNMSFIDYMEYVFVSENYNVRNYNDMTHSSLNFSDSKTLVSSSILKEYITAQGRWGNVGAGILPYCKTTKRFLLSYRSSYVLEPHTWGVWGGKIDDEDMIDIQKTAKREFVEETGYNKDIKIIPSYIFRSKNFEYHNFIGIIDSEFIPELDWETEDYKWVTFEELLNINKKHFGLQHLLDNNLEQIKYL